MAEVVKTVTKKVVLDPSYERLNQLHPLIRASAIAAYKEAVKRTPKGVHPVINETYRSYERSNELYAHGRTKKGPIVTNSPGGSSWHNFSLALDFYLLVDGKASWKVDDNWLIVVDCFEKRGFLWGGRWKTFKDYPHLECTMGLKLSEARRLHDTCKVDNDGFIIL